MDERIVILALTGSFESPSTRLRIIQMSGYLKKFNIDVKIFRYPRNPLNLVKILQNENYNVIWLQKKMPDFFKNVIFRMVKSPVVFDFDDNLTVRMKPKDGSYKSKTREIKFNIIKKMAYAFTCGNKFLSNLIEDTQKPFLIYPTPVPVNVPKKREFKFKFPVKLGWIGLSGGFMYLDKIFPQLEKLNEDMDIKLIVISDRDYKPECKFIKNIRWKLETQEMEITEFDIGIMPLNTNSPYDKGKCGYKILQYMAAGVIAVAENFGMNREIIKNGENGFLISDNNWYDGLKHVISKLKNYSELYKSISVNAIKTVEKKYSFEALAPKLAEFFKLCKKKS